MAEDMVTGMHESRTNIATVTSQDSSGFCFAALDVAVGIGLVL